MRGKAHGSVCHLRHYRITPAYAGKSAKTGVFGDCCKDHPRLCGEKSSRGTVNSTELGSPPPMRGKVYSPVTQLQQLGITPAYAGKSLPPDLVLRPAPDHPRLCGEKIGTGKAVEGHRGSPPPMRGKAQYTVAESGDLGITPAYAGKSLLSSSLTIWDGGSPPPMRGKVVSYAAASASLRITPAYAGKRCGSRPHAPGCQDHPRLCGEKMWLPMRSVTVSGSPPPMRGKD